MPAPSWNLPPFWSTFDFRTFVINLENTNYQFQFWLAESLHPDYCVASFVGWDLSNTLRSPSNPFPTSHEQWVFPETPLPESWQHSCIVGKHPSTMSVFNAAFGQAETFTLVATRPHVSGSAIRPGQVWFHVLHSTWLFSKTVEFAKFMRNRNWTDRVQMPVSNTKPVRRAWKGSSSGLVPLCPTFPPMHTIWNFKIRCLLLWKFGF